MSLLAYFNSSYVDVPVTRMSIFFSITILFNKLGLNNKGTPVQFKSNLTCQSLSISPSDRQRVAFLSAENEEKVGRHLIKEELTNQRQALIDPSSPVRLTIPPLFLLLTILV